ncbi:23S rRNA pseudouridine(955/2504/2580) synthase RluC [Leeia sp. TBRC 13508]|uniref:Pseudouridine synthase n=1 Tax=Leeia speluncae TaxID=2884804 RepID=A0ABS8D299_9NEIS|nr:23S rRNA pseudouridine(955/2504/2580) synthase RluC [Leeia speluncae]MCB6182111.1 23S rRNA pseudouridine(955/2504/2580) synthase RluC [Leeia speluncae]
MVTTGKKIKERGSRASKEKPTTERSIRNVPAPRKENLEVVRVKIDEDEAGQRLDNFLMKRLKGVPKSRIYRIIRGGEVRVNGKRAEVSDHIQKGDEIRIPPVRVAEKPASQTDTSTIQTVEFEVLFEDEALLVINKPSGVAVHGGSGISRGVIEQLRIQRPKAKFLELVHRLDRETSGVLLVAKKRAALVKLHEMMRANQTDKRYFALAIGAWTKQSLHVKAPLHKFLLPDGERRVRVESGGLASHTIFRLQKKWKDFALLEAELKTGRTHQIRVHLQHEGHPIAGDDKYGDFALNKQLQKQGLKRMFLHAWQMKLAHPISGEPLVLQAKMPPDLQKFIDQLPKNEG